MSIDEMLLGYARELDGGESPDELLGRARKALLQALADDPQAAGAAYEESLSRTLLRTDLGLQVVRSPGAHRLTGAYYTGSAVTAYMLQRASLYMPGAASLLDPACGSGAFLGAALRAYSDRPLRLVGLDQDRTALEICRQEVPTAELHAVDALLDDVPGGFDLCLGNPPYISTGLRGAGRVEIGRMDALRLRYPQAAQYKLNTYPLFIERGLELLRPGGVLGFIVPDSFLSGRYFTGLRQLLLAHTLLEITLIRSDFWEHGRVGQSVILFVRKGAEPPGHKVSVKVVQTVEELPVVSSTELPVSDIVWGPLRRFRLLPDARMRSLVARMEASAARCAMSDFLLTYSGLIGRRGQQSLLRSAQAHLAGPWGRLLRSGKEIDRYQLAWAGEEVCLDPEGIKSGGQLSYYVQPKLLLRQTSDSLRAVYDDQGFFCLNNIHVLVPRRPDVNLRALLALINSEPVNRLYRALTMETGRLYAQVDLDLFGALPVPALPQAASAALASLAQQREGATPEEAAPLEARIDSIVRELYGLT